MEHLAPTGTHLRYTAPPPMPGIEATPPTMAVVCLCMLLAVSVLLLTAEVGSALVMLCVPVLRRLLWLYRLKSPWWLDEAEALAEDLAEIVDRIMGWPAVQIDPVVGLLVSVALVPWVGLMALAELAMMALEWVCRNLRR